jgi:type I restriction enzyme M protein
MDSCIVICRKNKPEERKGKVLFIRAYDQIIKEKTQSFLSEEHISSIYNWYSDFKEVPGRTKIATLEEIRDNKHVINVALYARPELSEENQQEEKSIEEVISEWQNSSQQLRESYCNLSDVLKEVIN